MPGKKIPHRDKPIPVLRGQFGLMKMGASRFDIRDPYHLAVSLSWPAFAVALVSVWLTLNLVFALLYVLGPGAVANAAPGSFSDAFFFSVETLATVGYGVMAPATTYVCDGDRQRHGVHRDLHRSAVRAVLAPQGKDRLCRAGGRDHV
jgi:inward rectifier potassium channel